MQHMDLLLLPKVLAESNPKVLRRLIQATAVVANRMSPSGHCLAIPEDRLQMQPPSQAAVSKVQRADGDMTQQPHATSNRACSQPIMQRLCYLARSESIAIREGALCCLGTLVAFLAGRRAFLLNGAPLHEHKASTVTADNDAGWIRAFLSLVSDAVKPWQPWQVRAAAARALQLSGMTLSSISPHLACFKHSSACQLSVVMEAGFWCQQL